MFTQPPSVTIDAPPPSDKRAAAALAFAFRLREELLEPEQGESPAGRAPLHRLVHHAEPQQHSAKVTASELDSLVLTGAEGGGGNRYVAIDTQDVKRLQRITHLLSTLTSELTLWLASLPQPAEVKP